MSVPSTYSVSHEFDVLLQNKADIKAAIESMNPDMTPTDVMSEWADSVKSIPSSYHNDSEGNPVVFFDYDGNVLRSYSAEEAASLTTMPALPSHTGLTCQGWNYTLQEMKQTLQSVGSCHIGATYITDDGKTRVRLTIIDPKYTNINLKLSQSVSYGTSIDWGDGSSEETWSGTGSKTLTHIYSTTVYPTSFTINITVTEGSLALTELNLAALGSASSTSSNHYTAISSMLDSIFIGSGVTGIGSNFITNCSSLQAVTIPEGITAIPDHGLRNCSGIRHITLPSGVTSIGRFSLFNDYSLQSISLPPTLKSIGTSAFQNCYSIRFIKIPAGVTTLASSSFYYCQSLQNAVIPSGITNLEAYMFHYCVSLKTVTFPTNLASLGVNTFYACTSLKGVDIPSNVSSIGSNSFKNCSTLQSIVIPSGVTEIGTTQFSNCTGLLTYDFRRLRAVPSLSDVNAFEGTPDDKEIIVPDSLYNDWKSSTNWNSTTYNIVNCIVKASESSLGTLT